MASQRTKERVQGLWALGFLCFGAVGLGCRALGCRVKVQEFIAVQEVPRTYNKVTLVPKSVSI